MFNVKRKLVDELHKPARRKFKRRRIITKGLNDLFQADLVEMIPYSKMNNGYKYILTVIDVFSKYAWAVPVKNKTGKEVANAMKKILQERVPKNLHTDMGKEFYNGEFIDLMKKFHINHYSTYSTMKAAIVERFNRTLKSNMWKEFSYQGTYKWLKLLPELVNKYNKTRHHTTNMKPSDINIKNEKHLLNTVYSHIKMATTKNKFKVNDKVRISKYRELFSKGYTPNWSNEVFTIKSVKLTNPTTYLLQDDQGEEIKGAFYEEELQKTAHPNIFLIEKIIRRKGDKVFVKWLGFDSTHNSWVDKKDLT